MSRFIEAIERRGMTPWTAFSAATFVAGLRMMEEYVWVYLPRGIRREPLVWLGHTGLFYVALIASISALLHVTLGREPRRVVPAVAAGMIFGILPPLIDVAVYGPGNFGYEYHVGGLSTFAWHLFAPPRHTPLGEAITLWLSMGLMATYARLVGGSWWRVLATVIGHYGLIVLYLAVLPSWAYELGSPAGGVSVNEATGLVFTAATCVALAILRSAVARRAFLRLPHALLAPALVFLGSAWMGQTNGETALGAATLFLSALVFTLQNDYYDRALDAPQGRATTIDHDDVVALTLLPIPLWLILGPGHFWVVVCALLFLVVGFAYQGDTLRLKCVFPLSYKTEGLLGFLCLAAGVLGGGRADIDGATVFAMLLAAGGISIAAMLKDTKDLAADRAGGVRTIYVLLTARRWSPGHIDRLVAGCIAGCLAIPIVVLGLRGAAGSWLIAAALAGCLALVLFLGLGRRGLAVLMTLTVVDVYIVLIGMAL